MINRREAIQAAIAATFSAAFANVAPPLPDDPDEESSVSHACTGETRWDWMSLEDYLYAYGWSRDTAAQAAAGFRSAGIAGAMTSVWFDSDQHNYAGEMRDCVVDWMRGSMSPREWRKLL